MAVSWLCSLLIVGCFVGSDLSSARGQDASAGSAATAGTGVTAAPASLPPGFLAAPVGPPVKKSCLETIDAAIHAKMEAICNSSIGKFLHEMGKPLKAITGGGGATPGVGKPPTKTELAAPGPVGVSAKIKAEKIQAKARQQAVKELGQVDCHYFPEAEAMLIIALRADSSECVRFEAAKSLTRGCCCSKAVIQALNICVSGSAEDGHPSERSPLVKSTAMIALEVCMNSCGSAEAEAPVLPRPEFPGGNEEAIPAPQPTVQKTAFYQAVDQQPLARVVARSQRLLASKQQASQTPVATAPRRRSIYELWLAAEKRPQRKPANSPPPIPPQAAPTKFYIGEPPVLSQPRTVR